MSTTPASTAAAAHLIAAGALAAGYTALHSIRAARGPHGYHAGRAEIYGPTGSGDRDYSVRKPRDKAGLSNASSALDITMRGPGSREHQRAFTAYLVAAAAAGRADLVEVLGPDAQGRATWWGVDDGWQPKLGWTIGGKWVPVDASHEWHTHISFYRDTELGDRASMFAGFFGSTPPAPNPGGGGAPAPDPFPPAATHTFRLSGRVALRQRPQLTAPVAAWAASGSVIRAAAGRSGGPYSTTAPGPGSPSRLWLRVTNLNGRPLMPPLWTAEAYWLPLSALPPK